MLNFLDANIIKKVIPVFIVLFALALRVYGIDWDQSQHLHPDERFLTMTTDAMVWPESLAEYLSPSVSKLNPYNLGTAFYVYGTLPTTIVKYFSGFELFDIFQYNNIAITGRLISAIFDVGVVYLVYLIAKNVFNRKTGLLAAFLYAISVLPIQLSHFFAVDTFLNFFLVLSFYFLIKLLNSKTFALGYSILLGLSFGSALACKISALYFLPVIFLGLFFIFLKRKNILFTVYCLLFIIFCAIAFFRLLDPHVFTGNLFPPEISPQFIKNIKELQTMGVRGSTFPPAIQWNNITPIIFPLKNIVLWGLGLPLGILSVVAVIHQTFITSGVILKECKRLKNLFSLKWLGSFANAWFGSFDLTQDKSGYHRQDDVILVLFWILFLFFYQANQPAPSMRYFLPIYPFVSIITVGFLYNLSTHIDKTISNKIIKLLNYSIIILLLIYPISFLSIYSRPHSRVMASEWIYQNIPQGATLSCDAWDDCLPLSLDKGQVASQYKILTLEPFVPDSVEKIGKFESQLKEIDYLVLTSNRAWGSLPQWPEKFPYMVKFYDDLFAGRLNFQKVAEITSYPTIPILNIPIPDQSSEEAFTVYDHPKVLIYKNSGRN